MYKTKSFFYIAKFDDWLEKIQYEKTIEIVSVTNFNDRLLVTYHEKPYLTYKG